jgi:hypothetical protein
MMAVLNNAFANASSSLIQAKIMGIASGLPDPAIVPGGADGRASGWAPRRAACSWAW